MGTSGLNSSSPGHNTSSGAGFSPSGSFYPSSSPNSNANTYYPAGINSHGGNASNAGTESCQASWASLHSGVGSFLPQNRHFPAPDSHQVNHT